MSAIVDDVKKDRELMITDLDRLGQSIGKSKDVRLFGLIGRVGLDAGLFLFGEVYIGDVGMIQQPEGRVCIISENSCRGKGILRVRHHKNAFYRVGIRGRDKHVLLQAFLLVG